MMFAVILASALAVAHGHSIVGGYDATPTITYSEAMSKRLFNNGPVPTCIESSFTFGSSSPLGCCTGTGPDDQCFVPIQSSGAEVRSFFQGDFQKLGQDALRFKRQGIEKLTKEAFEEKKKELTAENDGTEVVTALCSDMTTHASSLGEYFKDCRDLVDECYQEIKRKIDEWDETENPDQCYFSGIEELCPTIEYPYYPYYSYGCVHDGDLTQVDYVGVLISQGPSALNVQLASKCKYYGRREECGIGSNVICEDKYCNVIMPTFDISKWLFSKAPVVKPCGCKTFLQFGECDLD